MPRGIPKSKNPELYGKTQKTKKKVKAQKAQGLMPPTLSLPFDLGDIQPPDKRYEAQQDANNILEHIQRLNDIRSRDGLDLVVYSRLVTPLLHRLEERFAEAYPAVTYEVTEKGTTAVVEDVEVPKFDSEDDDEPEVIAPKPVVSFQPEA